MITYPEEADCNFGLYLKSGGKINGGKSSLYSLWRGANFDEDDSMKTRSSLPLVDSINSLSGLGGSTLMWGGPCK
jgi:hypothetical protein